MTTAANPDVRPSGLINLTAADARRMEAAEEYGALRYAQALQLIHPDWDIRCEEFCGGHLVFVQRTSLVGRAHGLGFSGQVTAEDIEHVVDFYFRREADAQVDVCPYADPSLFESLNRAGFQVAEFNQTLARWIGRDESFTPTSKDFEIRPVQPPEGREWSGVLAQVFLVTRLPSSSTSSSPGPLMSTLSASAPS